MRGKSGSGPNSKTRISRKTRYPIWMIVAIWFLAIGSLLGTHYFLNSKKPRADRVRIEKIEAKVKSLTDG